MKWDDWCGKVRKEVGELPEPLTLVATRLRRPSGTSRAALKIHCLELKKRFAWRANGQVHWHPFVPGTAKILYHSWEAAALHTIETLSAGKAEAAGDMALVVKLEAIAERIRQSVNKSKPEGGVNHE